MSERLCRGVQGFVSFPAEDRLSRCRTETAARAQPPHTFARDRHTERANAVDPGRKLLFRLKGLEKHFWTTAKLKLKRQQRWILKKESLLVPVYCPQRTTKREKSPIIVLNNALLFGLVIKTKNYSCRILSLRRILDLLPTPTPSPFFFLLPWL